jgi:hypothetical protein
MNCISEEFEARSSKLEGRGREYEVRSSKLEAGRKRKRV